MPVFLSFFNKMEIKLVNISFNRPALGGNRPTTNFRPTLVIHFGNGNGSLADFFHNGDMSPP